MHRHLQNARDLFPPVAFGCHCFQTDGTRNPTGSFANAHPPSRIRNYCAPPPSPISPSLRKDEVPHITVIRPVKGLEAGLYECLASTFRQTYPREKLTICLCVSSANDPAVPVLKRVIADFPGFDSRLLIEEEDPVLHGKGGNINHLGPNPKIRNISRAYREAKPDDVIWIIDCNVWISSGVAGRMIDKLYGYLPDGGRTKPYKFVHQLPMVVDIGRPQVAEAQGLLDGERGELSTTKLFPANASRDNAGSGIEEMFMATSHAKFYCAISTVAVAPCIVGKSNMFRKAHLDRLTDPAQNPILPASDASRGHGVDFFSSYICEDHLIGDLLWRSNVPGHRNHGLVFGDLAIQPVSGMSVGAYWARRVRWLRVRKWTVMLATMVEPGIEPFLCSLYISFGLTTVPWFHGKFGIPHTWGAMALTWLATISIWMCVDRWIYGVFHKFQSVEVDENTPAFARGTGRKGGLKKKPLWDWIISWLSRESLALPIWTTAVYLGTTVTWRGKSFKVRMNMSVVEVDGQSPLPTAPNSPGGLSVATGMARSPSKDRVD